MNVLEQRVDFTSSRTAASGAPVIGTACPFCQTMLRDGLGTVAGTPPRLLDIAQIAAAALPPEKETAAP